MAGPLRVVVISLMLGCAPAFSQQVQQADANLQALLNALIRGSQVALLTPLSNGLVEVTSFSAPGQRSAAEAARLVESARINLANLGVARPTGQQLATALGGGVIDLPTGRTQLPSVFPRPTTGVTVSSQVVNAANLPTVVGMSPAGVIPGQATAAGQAAAGGTATPPNGGLAGQMTSPQTPQAPIVSPLPPSYAAPQPITSTPLIR